MLTRKRLLESVDSINDLLSAHDLDLEIVQEIIQDSVDVNESILEIAGPLMVGSRQSKVELKIISSKVILGLLRCVDRINNQRTV